MKYQSKTQKSGLAGSTDRKWQEKQNDFFCARKQADFWKKRICAVQRINCARRCPAIRAKGKR